MRIYGKTLPEVFSELPWPYKIVVGISIVFLIYIIAYFAYLLLKPAPKNVSLGPLLISSKVVRNILDPSLAVAADNATVYLAYTAIATPSETAPDGGIGVRIATAAAPCKNWQNVPQPFMPRPDELVAPDGQTVLSPGAWRYETPSIVFDPGDPGREWKIYAYKYFWPVQKSLASAALVDFARRYSAIVYKYTGDPARQPWSQEEWVLAAAPDYPPLPYQGLVTTHLADLSPALSGFTAYSRPSVIVAGQNLLMTLSAFGPHSTSPEAVVLLGSTDHGRSWVYMGTPLSHADAALAGPYARLSGATLLVAEGKIYLAAVFGDDKTESLGTFILGFSDVSSGMIARNAKGAPVILKHIPLQSETPTATGGGFAAYADACAAGLLTSEFSGVTQSFQIFNTYQTPAAGAE